MESDLISRSAVLEVAMRYLPDDDGSCSNANEDPRNMLDDIECIPAIDAVPVVHARWIPIKLYGEDHAIKCSACNNCDNPSKVPGRYCWQCGARMDGEAE